MKRVLVLGSSGMLGSRIASTLLSARGIEITITGRRKLELQKFSDLNFRHFDAGVSDLEQLIKDCRPHYVVNALGWIKQKQTNPTVGIIVNSLIPYQLAELSFKYDFKIFHFSTDCVFDGKKGNYTVKCLPNPTDFYGKSKLLGEITDENVICLRTSIIGYELGSSKSLLEWILKQRLNILGYSNAIFSGVSTNELSRLVLKVIEEPFSPGLYHIASEPISKLNLIRLVLKETKQDCKVLIDRDVRIDRSLVPNYQYLGVNWKPLDWAAKISNIIDEGRIT